MTSAQKPTMFANRRFGWPAARASAFSNVLNVRHVCLRVRVRVRARVRVRVRVRVRLRLRVRDRDRVWG